MPDSRSRTRYPSDVAVLLVFLLLALLTLVLTLSGVFGFGFAFAAYTLIVKESAQTVANMLQFALMAVCAMFFPFSVLPGPVRAVSYAIPLSYGVDLFRSALMGFPPGYPELLPVGTEIVIVALWGLLMPTLGWRWLLAFSSLPLLIFALFCTWLPESATECTDSASIEEEPVTRKPTNLAMAIARLARGYFALWIVL